ncbi:MAG: glutamine--fructose-6-phosphate transaminase (isomerizing) [bacterium]|nr:glutamine--fructose-6-phosphate transaminase (isomerizing) [bacterium]
MCGIIGYLGGEEACPILIEGLKRLEYRGYDSAGIATVVPGAIAIRKRPGKIAALEALLREQPIHGTTGIAHTRWATHGPANEVNAHPHTGMTGRIAIVHNGIIENYATLRTHLEREGHVFHTETDSEVIAHLIERHLYGPAGAAAPPCTLAQLEAAVSQTAKMLEGTFGIAVVCADVPDALIGARKGSPLVLGVGNNEMFLASDVNAFVLYTRQVIYLDDNEMVTLRRDGYQTSTFERRPVTKDIQQISWDADEIGRGGYPHFMLKEICEQPETIRNAFRGRLLPDHATAKLGGLHLSNRDILLIDRIVIVACGTALHAGMVGKYVIEELARIPVEVDYASEFRYRNPIIRPNTLVLAISQSGETADTLAAVREARQKGATVMGICNVVGSTIARECEGGVYVHAGPEIGVASTKAFTSQLTVMVLLALYFGRVRDLSRATALDVINALQGLPEVIKEFLAQRETVRQIAERYVHTQHAFFIGRTELYPVALEGALKLKEISYIDANGYPAAEMKHGPIALVDEQHLTVALVPEGELIEKMLSNVQEIRARHGRIVAVTDSDHPKLPQLCDDIIRVPRVHPIVRPILMVVPLQLFAYYIAVARGCDVDQPRNLAKSVTVE